MKWKPRDMLLIKMCHFRRFKSKIAGKMTVLRFHFCIIPYEVIFKISFPYHTLSSQRETRILIARSKLAETK